MANPKFVLGINTLQFTRGIQYPVRSPREKLQVVDRTAGGTLQVEDLGVDIRRFPLIFRNLPKADYDALVTWYDSICDGAANEFTYYDTDETTYTVVMRTNPLDFSEVYYQKYSGELTLEVVG